MALLRHRVWWVRVFDFPRLQFLLGSLVLLVLTFVCLKPDTNLFSALVFAQLICAILNGRWILPLTPLVRRELKKTSLRREGSQIRIITANVLMTNGNSQSLVDSIDKYQPDIVLTMETNQWWQDALIPLEESYPYTVACPLENLYGMHLYSKFPLSDIEVSFLVEPDIPSIHALISLPGGAQVRAHFLHPAPPSPVANSSSSERDAELIAVAHSIQHCEQPVLIAGDFNDVPWSETVQLFRRVSKLLDPRVGRGPKCSFHADYWFLRWPLDYIFLSHHFTVSLFERLKIEGSDHYALLTEVSLEHEDCGEKTAPELTNIELDRAMAALDEQEVSKSDVPKPGREAK